MLITNRVNIEKDEPGDDHIECECSNCATKMSYSDKTPKKMNDTAIDFACSFDCAKKLGWFEPIKLHPNELIESAPKRTTDKPSHCPECHGPSTRGKGWKHTDTCKLNSTKKTTRPPCESCGGEPLGRGFNHKDSCPVIAKVETKAKIFCSVCHGPARGKGFSHAENCAAVADKKAEDARKKLNEALQKLESGQSLRQRKKKC